MPQEHTGQVGFEYAWKELLARSRLSGKSYREDCCMHGLKTV
jgi:brefeldin A-resistance guanine nucleotide exchange factor 1